MQSENAGAKIIFGLLLVIIGIPLASVGVGVIMIIVGLFLFISGVRNTSNESKTSSPNNSKPTSFSYRYSYNLNKKYDGYNIRLNMANGPSDTIYTFVVYIIQAFSYNNETKHLPVFTTNMKHSFEGNFSFSYLKEGKRDELNGLTISVDESQLIKPTELGPMSTYGVYSGYVAIILLYEKDNSDKKIIEQFEKLELSITQSMKDQRHSDLYGMQRFIELSVALAKVDGHFDQKEKNEIKSFIYKNAEYQDKIKLEDYFQSVCNIQVRNFDLIVKDIKSSIGAIRLITKGMELLINVSVSDGKLEETEKKYLEQFADAFNIEKATFNQLIRKYISSHDDFKLTLEFFGITNDMTVFEKKQKLNQAYAEWNKKIVSNNAQTRERAKVVIEFISSERLKLTS